MLLLLLLRLWDALAGIVLPPTLLLLTLLKRGAFVAGVLSLSITAADTEVLLLLEPFA